MDWRIHWLEADGDLSPWRDRIAAEIEAARGAVATVLAPFRLDILVQFGPGLVIPETGTNGSALRPSLCTLTLDPFNPNFVASLAGGDIRRTIAHEVHHCRRYAGPGYGKTLAEALVSEGLAGQFAGRLFDAPPEPWERALDEATLHAHLPNADELSDAGYDHRGWFFGSDPARPRWLGYTLGYRIVGEWLAATAEPDGETWVNISAATVLRASRRLATA